ncbi:DNA cytosine methyltransferase [Roseiconus lacunae]|uniref:DNA cytosine methyltransferase n=1 Tax=Roseiconus lacunae TaxID=2605694 RepID=UPI0036F3AA9C
MRTKPTFVEIFAGAGLMSHAFIKAGFSPILAVELDERACHSYRNNIGDHIVCGDVCRISPPDSCDVLVAGPPCQGFSTLNRTRADDPRNRLCFEVIRWAKRMSPQHVVIENVAPFANSEICQSLLERLKRLGYASAVYILNAADFGVAQERKRTFLIASKFGSVEGMTFRHRSPVTIAEAWRELPNRRIDPQGGIYPLPSELALARFKVIPRNGDRRDILLHAPELAPESWFKLRPNDNTGVWGRMNRQSVSPTIRTCFQNPSKGRYIHPTRNRVITLREAARLQTIPDSWTFTGDRSSVTRQIGNGVPVKLAATVARKCRRLLES